MADTTKPFLSNSTYDKLKWIAQIFLPALGTLYFAVSQIWGLPNATEIVGTISAVDIFLGLLLGLSTKAYDQSEKKEEDVLDSAKQIRGGDAVLDAAKEVKGPVAFIAAARELRGGYDGDIEVVRTARDEKTLQLNLDTPPEELEHREDVLFKLNRNEE